MKTKPFFAARAFAVCALVVGFIGLPAYAEAPQTPGFEDLAEKLLPTVVNVSTTMKAKATDRPALPPMPELPPGSPFDQFFKDFYDQYRTPPQGEDKTNALGSGFVIDAENGYVVTNNHVIKDADEIKVILQDNTSLDATLVGMDEKTDVAVLKIKQKTGHKLVAASWGDSDKARVGSWVVAIGNPFGLGGTVTAGIVSARQRNINAGPYDEFIQTDASINRGNSGGPMFNTAGEVVGVNTAIFSPSGGSVGIGFAIPSNLARSVAEQLIKYGKTKRGWIGVRIQEVTPEIAESLGLKDEKGALVSSITPKGPAETAGLEAGDVILSFDGHEIKHMRELPLIVAQGEIGKKATVSIWRKGAVRDFTLTLGQLEKAEKDGLLGDKEDKKAGEEGGKSPALTKIDDLGISLATLDDQGRDDYEIPKTVKGALVISVDKNSAASEKGVTVGDVIVEVDQQEVSKPDDVSSKVAAAKKAGHGSILFFIAHKTDMRFVAVKLKK